jgi:hypothetical protein
MFLKKRALPAFSSHETTESQLAASNYGVRAWECVSYGAGELRPKGERTMCLKSWQRGFTVLAALVVAPALLLGGTEQRPTYPPISPAYMWSFPNEASTLLQQLRTQALQVRDEAAHLQAFDREGSDISWQTDAGVLMTVKAHVNDMDATLFRLRGIRQMALPWQQRAISGVAPKVIELTDYVQDAIQNLNNNHLTAHLLDKSYALDADFMYQRANTIASSIHQFEEYAAARSEMYELSPKLGMNAGS